MEFWKVVVWERSFVWNAGGLLGIGLLLVPWVIGREHRRFAWLSLGSFILFLLPVVVFANVHFVHQYYQVACVAFLLATVSLVVGGWLEALFRSLSMTLVVTTVIALSNIAVFNSAYAIVAGRALDELDPRSVQAYKVGRYLRERTPPESGLVILGQGYSSEIAFQARRKAMTAPSWMIGYQDVWENPQKYLGDRKLGALVVCPLTAEFPSKADLKRRHMAEPGWEQVTVQGCEILLPARDW